MQLTFLPVVTMMAWHAPLKSADRSRCHILHIPNRAKQAIHNLVIL